MLEKIDINQIDIDYFDAILNENFVITAAKDDNTYNFMTCSWGTVGILFNKKVFQAYVRDHRYTYEFLKSFNGFTVSFFPPNFKKEIAFIGSHSGKDCNKEKECSLDVIEIGDKRFSFKQANTIFSCSTAMVTPIKEDNIIDKQNIDKFYKNKDYHYIFTGFIEEVFIQID